MTGRARSTCNAGVFDAALYGERGGYPPPLRRERPSFDAVVACVCHVLVMLVLAAMAVRALVLTPTAAPPARPCPSAQVVDLRPLAQPCTPTTQEVPHR